MVYLDGDTDENGNIDLNDLEKKVIEINNSIISLN